MEHLGKGKLDLSLICATEPLHDHKINRIDELLPWNWKPVANQAAAA